MGILSDMAQYLDCCKKVSLNKSSDGSVTVTAVGLIGDIQSLIDAVVDDWDVKLVNNTREGHIMSATLLVKSESYTYKKVTRNMVFKSIPVGLYTMYTRAINPKEMLPPIAEPDLDIRIKQTNDWFGENGWTIAEITGELGIPISIPGALDYHVYELSVKEGTPVLSFLRSLLPIPGLIISERNGSFYVNMCGTTAPELPISMSCEVTGLSSQSNTYFMVVEGLPSSPREIMYSGDDVIDLFAHFYEQGALPYYYSPMGTIDPNDTMMMQMNLVGGIYGVMSESFHSQDVTNYIEDMFRFKGSFGS